MDQALYRKYRSRSFGEVVGQDHITNTLSRAIKSGRVSHAYLFTGPRGVGKTSVARILAHEVNQLPYSDDTVHIDIIEIDAASNRRIDEIRDLRERVRTVPAAAKYKVYIIDEVHMLTREAFNALLKTLEEPPAHCIFILATTEAHKLPETIISRTQRFEFKPVSRQQASEHLASIAASEKISIEREALDLLAQFGGGSFRDSISYLDQLSSLGKKIDKQDVRELLGLPQDSQLSDLVSAIEAGDSQAVLENLSSIREQGVSPAAAASGIADLARQKLIGGESAAWLTKLLKQIIEVPASHRPYDSLEISLLEAAALNASSFVPKAATLKSAPVEARSDSRAEQSFSGELDMSAWDEVVERAKTEAASIYTALRLARPSYSDGVLTLSFQFPLHQKKISVAKNKELVAKLVEDVVGAKVAIEPVVDKGLAAASEPPELQPPQSLSAISNVFGQAEVLET